MNNVDNMNRGEALKKKFFSFCFQYCPFKLLPGMAILDFGCGSGSFLNAMIESGFDAYGIDCDLNGKKSYEILARDASKIQRWIHYDGTILPFKSQTFNLVFSWYVLEHVKDIHQALKEIVRILKPGGFCALFTQDAREAYDGHVRIPWPSYLHPKLYEVYMEEWGWDEILYLNRNKEKSKQKILHQMQSTVFYVTEPQIISILKYFNMNIIFSEAPDIWPSNISLNIQTAEDARRAAKYFKTMQQIGKWRVPNKEIAIAASKIKF